jgi:hypothetical protein
LRAAYDSTVQEPLPVRLADLVDRLTRREDGGQQTSREAGQE